eukprot:PLAT12563.1.p1 GENE.PLAT12563.1~~PLAT12563.1.p1  ORF type:complete len:160 (-),score=45.30 PLAT12563.1:101-559(-)
MDALPTSPVSFLYTPPEEDGELGVIDMEISLDGGGPDDGAAAATSASEGGKREEAGGVPLVAMSDALVDKVELERMKSLQARIGTSLQSGCIQLKQFNECSEEMLTEAGVEFEEATELLLRLAPQLASITQRLNALRQRVRRWEARQDSGRA